MNEDRYSIVSADTSGVPASLAWTRVKSGTFEQLAPGYVTGLAENVCVNDTEPRGLLHPRTYLSMFYRAEALAALAAGGHVPSAAPPDDWEQLIALLEAHRLATNGSSSGTGSSSSGVLPKYGLCITTHPDCGRLGDVWAAMAASVLQTQGTAQGYLYDLAAPPPLAVSLANSTGWVHATQLLRHLLVYNAPEPGVREHRECSDVSSHFVAGDCMITFDWDVSVVKLRTAALRPPEVQLRVAPLPGSRTVMDRRAGSSTAGQLVPCDWELCGVSANHDLLYLPGPGHPSGGGAASPNASAAAASVLPNAPAPARCSPEVVAEFEAVEAKAVRAGLGPSAEVNVQWALVNRAPYSVMIQHFVRYQASTVGNTTSPARRFEALGEAVDTMVARVAILRGSVMAAARRGAGFPPANESAGITGNPYSYLRTRWWGLLRRPFDVRPYLALGLTNDTMQSNMAALLHGTHSPNAASDVTSPIQVNFAKWALSQAVYVLEPPAAGAEAVANATAEVLRILGMMELAFGQHLLRSAYEDAVNAPDWTPAVVHSSSAGSQGNDVMSQGALAGLLVGLIVVVSLSVLALVFVALRMRRRHRDILGRVRAPRPGPDTTLLISDIQNSTRLWEELSVNTMDAALKTHHAVFRKLMPAHDGYESATEGDSFIVAFPSPASALAFATACQLALLQQDWPQELLQHPDGAVVAVEARGGDALQVLAGATTSATAAAMAASMALARRSSDTPKQSESGFLTADSGALAPLTGPLSGRRSLGQRRMLKSLDLPRNVEREPLPPPASMLSMTTRSRPTLSLCPEPAAPVLTTAPAELNSQALQPLAAVLAAPALDPTAAAAAAEWEPLAAARGSSNKGRWSQSTTPLVTVASASSNTESGCNTAAAAEAAAGAGAAPAALGGDAAIAAALAAPPAAVRTMAELRTTALGAATHGPSPRASELGLPAGSTATTLTERGGAAFGGPSSSGISVSQPGAAPPDQQPASLVDDAVPQGPSSQPGGRQSYAGGSLWVASSRSASCRQSLKGTWFAAATAGGPARAGDGDSLFPPAPVSAGAAPAAGGDDAPLQLLRRMLVPAPAPRCSSGTHLSVAVTAPRVPSPWLGGARGAAGAGRTAPGNTAGDKSVRPEADSTVPGTGLTWGQALGSAFPAAVSAPVLAATASRRGKRRLSNAAQAAMGFLSGSGASAGGTVGSNMIAFRGLRVRMGIHTSPKADACVVTFNRVNSTYHYSGTLAETAKLVSDAATGGLVVLSAHAFTRLRNTDKTAAAAKADAVVIYAGHYVLRSGTTGSAPAANGTASNDDSGSKMAPGPVEAQGAVKGAFERVTEGLVGLVLDGSNLRRAKTNVRDGGGPALASAKLMSAPTGIPDTTTATTGGAAPGEVPLFVAVPASLLCRLAHTPPLRTVRQVQLGSLAAPTGSVTIAFMKVVGASTLLTDLPGPARRALDQFQRLACGLLLSRSDMVAADPAVGEAGAADQDGNAGCVAANGAAAPSSGVGCGGGGGYLVEGGDGLVLAAFGSPLAAVEWALDTLERLKGLAWEEELLAHEMCEEVLTAGPAPVSTSPMPLLKSRATSSGGISITAALPSLPAALMREQQPPAQPHQSRLLPFTSRNGQRDVQQPQTQQPARSQPQGPSLLSMRARWRSLERGLRVKVGLDVGPVTYSLTESSGRLSYRGRVMNRAARIAGTASPGQVLCSGGVWAACEAGMAAGAGGAGAASRGYGYISNNLLGARLGTLALKGIQAPVEVVQCFRAGATSGGT
ncbi:hypothetical protein HYH02_010381 [Chlamydomonas schloesseri]|uniref:Guanylate cyclase domain-containing protein n=1 Tax=Chlamydomonas schloesseri TaxID=2026947 RepID=A0A835W7Q9_9CHLO|nr:hypothetical protein HYH02_010381 [Chlamydomonas schloesseri]|eukprot:KAG2440503.1 hypothetical protein HYH02_010381 [Chlamydomonas schloesseri]